MKNIIRRFYILPKKGKGFSEQLDESLNEIKSYFENSADYQIIHQLFFVKSESNREYVRQKEEIFNSLKNIYVDIPSTSVIAQLPDNGFLITVELMVLVNRTENLEISYRENNEIYYTVINTEDYRQIFAGGITIYEPDRDYSFQANEAYRLMSEILDREKMSFSDVVRQWNYIEDILGIKALTDKKYQNYQVLNDVRAQYYAREKFKNGYPASTGIGMNAGGIILEFISIKPENGVNIVPLKNPGQIDAYNYSQGVLIGSSLIRQDMKSSPKFERAKYISINEKKTIYVSGTASIRDEKTIGENDVKKQTWVTIENIDNLISDINLKNAGISNNFDKMSFSFIRVYVKNKSEIKVVKEICDSYYKNVPINYLVADICRDNLLVEIEGIVELI
jgi:enamine deaminase RidA (YjgF/YER057c/UK114 family)